MPCTACHRPTCAQPRSRRRDGTLLQEGMRLMCYCARHTPLPTPDKGHARGAAARQLPTANLRGKAAQASNGSLASAKSNPAAPQQSSRCVSASLVTISHHIPFRRVLTAHWLVFVCAIGFHVNTPCATMQIDLLLSILCIMLWLASINCSLGSTGPFQHRGQ
jgi:hypothetical protein